MILSKFNNKNFDRGATRLKEFLWIVTGSILISSWVPGSLWRVVILSLFGANVGKKVILKPGIKVKFPWRLSIGDYSWIGEDVWIDNLCFVNVGSEVCISQGAYLCTGSHDWTSTYFDLIVEPINIESNVWICAMCRIAPGVTISHGCIVGFGSVLTKSLEPWSIYKANSQIIGKNKRAIH